MNVNNILIVLNNPQLHKPLYDKLKCKCSKIIACDGGSRFAPESEFDQIIGDFDSAVLDESNPKQIHSECQETTDFMKAINFISANFKDAEQVHCFGALDGRFDHTMSSLYNFYNQPQMNLQMYGTMSVVFRINGRQFVKIDDNQDRKGMGVFSLNGPTWVKTKGFNWDFEQEVDATFYSSSNEVAEGFDEVQLETRGNQFVLMSLTLQSDLIQDRSNIKNQIF